MDGARRGLDKQRTVQFLMCGIGGVDSQNGSRLTISGPGMTYDDDRTPDVIGGSVLPPFGGHPFEQFHENAAKPWWEEGCRPRCRRWNGSADFQGSVAQALWEFPQVSKPAVLDRGFLVTPYYEHFCANPFGC